MSGDQHHRDHVSSVFTNITSLERSRRKPLAQKPINLSHLVQTQKTQQRSVSKDTAAISRSSISKLIVTQRQKRPDNALKPMAGLLSSNRSLQFAKSEHRIRPRRKTQSSFQGTGNLVNKIMKSVNAFETNLRLQRHRSKPVQFDIFISAKKTKLLSPTELMVITEDSTESNALILHSHTVSNVAQRRGAFKLLLSSQSSLTLYSGLKWYFEWQVL
ncbi:LAFA_0E18778g1_1 [Lachancea sp. 'fantastica']|nr:LAFA_0E18778g1_1 [Lachancea sp. 'fantastica']